MTYNQILRFELEDNVVGIKLYIERSDGFNKLSFKSKSVILKKTTEIDLSNYLSKNHCYEIGLVTFDIHNHKSIMVKIDKQFYYKKLHKQYKSLFGLKQLY